MYIASVFRVLKRLKLTSCLYYAKRARVSQRRRAENRTEMKTFKTTLTTAQRYNKKSRYANFTRKILKYTKKAVILRRQN